MIRASAMQVWCNGKWMEDSGVSVSLMDRGFSHGLGLFETLLGVGGKPMFWERHLRRLEASCRRLGWRWDLPEFYEIATRLLEINGLADSEARIRIAVTAGSGVLGDMEQGDDALWMVTARAIDVSPEDVSALVCPWRRNEHAATAGMKCSSYAENLVALDHARRHGFAEAIFLNGAGHVCEAATANVFWVKSGVVYTPSLAAGCLPGIARELVLEMAGMNGVPCVECDVGVRELEDAEEVFLTSSLRGIQRLERLGDRMFQGESEMTLKLKMWWRVARGD